MRVTGVTRKIDELGRIVIPKEIRKSLKIQEGSEMEIYVQNAQIILTKYSPLFEYSTLANDCIDVVVDKYNTPCFMCDKDKIVASGLLKKDLINQDIALEVVNVINKGKKLLINNPYGDRINFLYCYIIPIINQGDIFGGLIIFCNEKNDYRDIDILINFLSKQL